MKKIIYTRPDGGLSILNLNPEMFDPQSRTRELLRSKGKDFTDDAEVLAFIIAKDVPGDATKMRIVEEGAIPKDRARRNALTDRDIK